MVPIYAVNAVGINFYFLHKIHISTYFSILSTNSFLISVVAWSGLSRRQHIR